MLSFMCNTVYPQIPCASEWACTFTLGDLFRMQIHKKLFLKNKYSVIVQENYQFLVCRYTNKWWPLARKRVWYTIPAVQSDFGFSFAFWRQICMRNIHNRVCIYSQGRIFLRVEENRAVSVFWISRWMEELCFNRKAFGSPFAVIFCILSMGLTYNEFCTSTLLCILLIWGGISQCEQM